MGQAFTCSTEKDKGTCCCFRYVKDVKPRPLNPHDIYQQFQVIKRPYEENFVVKSLARDGFPPEFLRKDIGQEYYSRVPPYFQLEDAHGLDSKLRASFPKFDFSISGKSPKPIVGKWYCPFIFVKEGTLRSQMTRSMYYKMTLEQRWEKIFSCHNCNNNNTRVSVDAIIEREEVFVEGCKAKWDEKRAIDGVIWLTGYGLEGEETSVGLRMEIVERIKWEQARGGWVKGDERLVKINKVEECEGGVKWSEFGCYVLVERFKLRRMDGSLVVSYDFRHWDKMRTKWE